MDFGMLEPLCAAHQVPDYRQFIRSGQRMFHIEVKVEYEYLADPPPGATSDCRDNRLMLDVSREVRSTFLVEADQFLRDAEGEQSVREMLRLAGVLYTRRNEFMVWIVLRKAESMARDPRNRDAEVLSMRVSISCADPCIHREQLMNREDEGLEMAYDEAEETDPEEAEETDPEEAEETDPEEADEAEETDPEELDEAEDMDPDEADDEEGMAMMGPGLAGLTEVEVKERSVDCVICCEGIVVGSTGSALPCCHVYHRECIAKWLGKSRTCPLCRFELPSTD